MPDLIRRSWKAVSRRRQRYSKLLWQRIWLPKETTRLAFVFGCQRSGTGMLLKMLDRCPEVMGYYERDHPAMGRDLRLKEEVTIRRLLERSPAHLVAIKPIVDSQWADELLVKYEASKALWIFRHYRDVVNSILLRFTGQMERMKLLIDGEWDQLGWRTERLSRDNPDVQLAVKLSSRLTREDAAAIVWMMRTRLYFKTGMDQLDQARLVKYESLVAMPREVTENCFEFLELPYRSDSAAFIHNSSVRKNEPPKLIREVQDACEKLQRQLDAAYVSQAGDWPT